MWILSGIQFPPMECQLMNIVSMLINSFGWVGACIDQCLVVPYLYNIKDGWWLWEGLRWEFHYCIEGVEMMQMTTSVLLSSEGFHTFSYKSCVRIVSETCRNVGWLSRLHRRTGFTPALTHFAGQGVNLCNFGKTTDATVKSMCDF